MIKKIKEKIKEKGLSQRKLAELTNISYPTINSILTNKSELKVVDLKKIAKVLNVPIGYFFDENTGQTDNKEFDEFLSDLIYEVDTTYINISEMLHNVLKQINCHFEGAKWFDMEKEFNIEFDFDLIFWKKALALFRKDILFKNDKTVKLSEKILIKDFDNVDSKTKKEYVIKMTSYNDILSELYNDVFAVFVERVSNSKYKYINKCTKADYELFKKKYSNNDENWIKDSYVVLFDDKSDKQ